MDYIVKKGYFRYEKKKLDENNNEILISSTGIEEISKGVYLNFVIGYEWSGDNTSCTLKLGWDPWFYDAQNNITKPYPDSENASLNNIFNQSNKIIIKDSMNNSIVSATDNATLTNHRVLTVDP